MFKEIKNSRIYHSVIEQIQSMLMDGELKAGDRLPTERDLSQQLGVSRASVREALRALEIIGIVDSRQGEGTFISHHLEHGGFEPLSVLFAIQNGTIADILQVRLILETEMAALAARALTRKSAAQLRRLQEQLAGEHAEEERIQSDALLHATIARMTGNPLLITLFSSISKLMDTTIAESRKTLFQGTVEKRRLQEQHLAICQAILDKDPDAARQAMRAHLTHVVAAHARRT